MPDGGSFSIQTQNLTLGHSEAADLGLSSGSYVCLTARDSGTGMEPEVIEHAFEPFFTTKPSAEGGGLGLASVYGMTRQAGGTAAISQRPAPARPSPYGCPPRYPVVQPGFPATAARDRPLSIASGGRSA